MPANREAGHTARANRTGTFAAASVTANVGASLRLLENTLPTIYVFLGKLYSTTKIGAVPRKCFPKMYASKCSFLVPKPMADIGPQSIY